MADLLTPAAPSASRGEGPAPTLTLTTFQSVVSTRFCFLTALGFRVSYPGGGVRYADASLQIQFCQEAGSNLVSFWCEVTGDALARRERVSGEAVYCSDGWTGSAEPSHAPGSIAELSGLIDFHARRLTMSHFDLLGGDRLAFAIAAATQRSLDASRGYVGGAAK